MLRLRLVAVFCMFVAAAGLAAECPKLAKGQKPKTLYEKYCNPNEDVQQDKPQTKAEQEKQVRQARQERFLGSSSKVNSKVNVPDKSSQPGYKLPKQHSSIIKTKVQ